MGSQRSFFTAQEKSIECRDKQHVGRKIFAFGKGLIARIYEEPKKKSNKNSKNPVRNWVKKKKKNTWIDISKRINTSGPENM